jgi:deoxyhypusine synthase
MTEKDKKIIENAENENIPIFVFTAKDALSTEILLEYEARCMSKCDFTHIEGVRSRIKDFVSWQKANIGKVKIPD